LYAAKLLAVKDRPEDGIALGFISHRLINFISNKAVETQKQLLSPFIPLE
jgi:hypothetical protein